MARPKKDDALGATAFIGLRLPPEMREALEKAAKRHGTNIATEARHAIALGLEADRKRKASK